MFGKNATDHYKKARLSSGKENDTIYEIGGQIVSSFKEKYLYLDSIYLRKPAVKPKKAENQSESPATQTSKPAPEIGRGLRNGEEIDLEYTHKSIIDPLYKAKLIMKSRNLKFDKVDPNNTETKIVKVAKVSEEKKKDNMKTVDVFDLLSMTLETKKPEEIVDACRNSTSENRNSRFGVLSEEDKKLLEDHKTSTDAEAVSLLLDDNLGVFRREKEFL
jgi:hypothetical protein